MPPWFWIRVAALIVLLVVATFVIGWIFPDLFAWALASSSPSIVWPLTVGLVVIAAVLGCLSVWQRRKPKST